MSPTKDNVNGATVSRRPREDFSEKGVVIREVEDGVRCEQCKTNCPGFAAHDWRKTCQSCKCPREAHAIYQQQTTSVHERLGFKVVSPADSGVEPRDLGYTWVPPGIRASSRINRYFEQLPADKVPKIGSEGARYREQQIAFQLPKQDLSLQHCKHLEDQHGASFEDFVTARNEIALDIGYIKDAPYDEHCAHCEGEINTGDMVVAAPKFVESVMWHPRCFACSTCNELLVDLTYCVHEDKIYCERHYAEMLKPRCAGCDENDPEGLKRFQQRMRNELATAEALENSTGLKAMQDGVLYKDGIRIDPQQKDVDKLKDQQRAQELTEQRRKEIEAELKRQKEIEEQTRRELERAEAELARQRREAEAAEKRQRAEEEATARKQQVLVEQREVAENARKLLEAERRREEEQQREELQKEAEENTRRLLEAEREREAEERRKEAVENEERQWLEEEARRREEEAEEEERQRVAQEAAENERKLLEAERQREEAERQREEEELRLAEEEAKKIAATTEQEAAENVEKLLEAEREKEAEQRQREVEEAELVTKRNAVNAEENAPAQKEIDEQAVIDSIQKYLDAEAEREMQRQQLIEENARKFLEADEEMGELQQRLEQTPHQKERLSAIESEPQTPVYEPPCVKKIVTDHWSSPDEEPEERVTQTVKTQFGQADNEPYSLKSRPLLFTSISDDTSSIEPQSSFSAHQSDEFATGTDNTSNTIDAHFLQLEREEPEGEDNDNMPTTQYSDDYLRSLDGIKSRPLMREDGSGRRRAFKKRRSSGSSNSSRDSRASREEEVKMFTSLEEEELQAGKVGEGDFTPIKYTSEPTLKVKSLRRRHKRSPAKDMLKSTTDNSARGSLEMLDEENTNPWGELTPEHYKELEFWKREKAISIDEEEIDLERPSAQHDVGEDVGAKIVPKTSSFEEATHTENEAAMSALQQQTKEERAGEEAQLVQDATARSDTKPNLQSSHKTEGRASAGRSSASPRLRRSPRVDEMDQYEERWNAETAAVAAGSAVTPETPQTPSISIHTPTDTAAWRDQYGLMMEGLSDFYDFTASVNPSRSRATSRQPSPASSQPSSPLPKNVANSETDGEDGIVDVYDDTGKVGAGEFRRENIIGFIESLASSSSETVEGVTEMEFAAENSQKISGNPENVADTADRKPDADAEAEGTPEIQMLVQTLRAERGTSRSRSRSPLPTTDNLAKSLENRRHKLIKQNDELFEKLQAPAEGAAVESRGVHSPLTLDVQAANEYQSWTSSSTPEEKYSAENVNQFSDSSHSERSKSRSRSRSPLHTPDNIERRQKLVQHNDELFDKLHVHSPVEIEIQPAEDDPPLGNPYSPEEEFSRENMNLLVEKLRNDRSRSRSRSHSRSPLPTADNIERGLEKRRKKLIQHNDELFEKLRVDSPIEVEIQLAEDIQTADEECSKENMNLLVETLRTKRSRSRSRSRSPLPTADNIQRSLETRRHKMIQHNDAVFEQLAGAMSPSQMNAPTISIECAEDTCTAQSEEVECSRENMSSLVAALRMRRSRSTSKSPMRFMERERTPEPSCYAADIQQDQCEERELRSRTPSRSQSNSPSRQEAVGSPTDEEVITNISDCYDFHTMLNLEASQNKTLVKCSEEMESVLVEKQRLLDQEALHKLNTASEEVELRTLTPVTVDALENEANDKLGDMPLTERIRQLRCSPTTPDYDRSISAEWRDVQRIKSEMISSGFKRSTYVGESMDLGSEFKPLREETARFRRSQSPSPSSYIEGDKDAAVQNAAEKRQVQAQILAELFSASDSVADENRLGAKPKAERESVDLSGQYEEMRRINAEFQRSRSQSRSPLGEMETAELAGIEMEAVRREFQDKVLDEIEMSSVNFQEFSRHLNPDFLDTDRRASDSVLIQKPELLIQLQDMDADLEMDPEDYHHFRRFSLNQEQSVEEYPSDDYIYVSQIEVQTPTGTRTWIREDYYSENFEQLNLLAAESEIAENVSVEEALVEKVEQDQEQEQQVREEEESDGSEDERQTVVEVEDEIDEDICDFNERGPADESHHEQSECEEAEREMDRYAGRGAEDWQEVEDINELLVDNEAALDEGAVGGPSPGGGCDSDSCAIDEIYDEAIRNRKQSGILRDYDSLLKEMQNNYMEREDGGETADSDRYAIWTKTRALKKHKLSRQNGNESATVKFIENERNDAELRYLGDANVHARQSTRLRSRYGYVPLLHSNAVDDVEVDLNYKPKKEYNWRKNFKLDEDGRNGADGVNNNEAEPEESAVASGQQLLDLRKYSLGGESITLFSQSPEKVRNENNDGAYNREEELVPRADTAKAIQDAVANEVGENVEKGKKKKGKKKLRKESKNSTQSHSKDEDDSESQMYSRRSSSTQMDTDSPKRKSRSRRSSKSSLSNEDPTLLSPRSSIVIMESFDNIQEEFGTAAGTTTNLTTKKKTKKRKKTKDAFAAEPDIKEEYANEQSEKYLALDLGQKVDTISAIITPETASINLLAALSPQNSVCATPGSIKSECSEQTELAVETTTVKTPATATPSSTIPTPAPAVTVVTRTATTSTTTTRTTVDTFDILKDANFYPLF